MEMLKAKFTVTVTDAEEERRVLIEGLVMPDMDTMDRAYIALNLIKSLNITISDVVLSACLTYTSEEENDQ